MSQKTPKGLTGCAKLIINLLIFALLAGGIWFVWRSFSPRDSADSTTQQAPPPLAIRQDLAPESEILVRPLAKVPDLPAPGTYSPQDGIVQIELSEYAGYAGLIAANKGLAPHPESYFAKNHGFQVAITLSEEESWPALQRGEMAASATTVDVLAAYGRQFAVQVPAQIGFSRGADGIVVRSGIKRLNDLKGKAVATAQFTEADFFLRYLAGEASIPVRIIEDWKEATSLDPEAIHLIYCVDAFASGDFFLRQLAAGDARLAGCVTWAPRTQEVVEEANGAARLLVTNRNLLIIADILIVNRGFAEAHPEMVEGLVAGLLAGNKMVRENPEAHTAVLAKAFGWSEEEVKEELRLVHLSNLAENLAFFAGRISSAGSFAGIFQTAVLSYGSELTGPPADPERFLAMQALTELESTGVYKGETVTIQPIRAETAGAVESDPLLSRDVRFLFEPNSADLALDHPENEVNLTKIQRMIAVSPGSTILLRGHVDDALVEDFRKQGGESFVRTMALKAMELSKARAQSVREQLIQIGVDGPRIETVGRGWEEPLGGPPEENRRVEVQWFTVE